MRGFHNVTIRPTITASLQTPSGAAFSADDVVFDWTKFRVPKRIGRLIGCTALVRGVDGAAQRVAMDFYFSKSDDFSLGTIHGGVSVQPNNDFLGAIQVVAGSYMASLNTMEVANVSTTARVAMSPVLDPDTETLASGRKKYPPNEVYVMYIGGVAQAGLNLGTAAITSRVVDVSGLSAAQLVAADIEGTDPRTCFAPGDIIHVQDDIILGEIATIPDADTITFKTDGSKVYHAGGILLHTNPSSFADWQTQNGADAAGDLASSDELLNLHPITITLTFAYEH